ncbi:MAG: hypothetical protein QM808_16235 [Steroidobacteraceae bacterium]
MTIAACYVSPEGVVLGADSTASAVLQGAPGITTFHYFNHNQKVFQIGETGSLGVVTWGLGGLGNISHRTLIAQLSDDLSAKPAADLLEVGNRWASLFWASYSAQIQAPGIDFLTLQQKLPFDPNGNAPNTRTKEEEQRFQSLSRDLVVGFCIGGYVLPNRTPGACIVTFDPTLTAPPAPKEIAVHTIQWFGVPNLILRLINGCDIQIRETILNSGKWSGTAPDLDALLGQFRLSHSMLPIRDAINFVYTSIYSTIKAMKFSSLPQVCGGPIELAVITSDRAFRWVRHKTWDSAIDEG